MAEENQAQQVTKEPQQITKEPQGKAVQVQRVTTKDPKKVESGKRLAAINHKKREAKKREEQAQLERIGVNQYYGIGALTLWEDRWPWLLHLSVQERPHNQRSHDASLPTTMPPGATAD